MKFRTIMIVYALLSVALFAGGLWVLMYLIDHTAKAFGH